MELDPGCFEAHLALAKLHLGKNSPKEAIPWLQSTLASNPFSNEARLLLGRVKLDSGQSKEALLAFVHAAQQDKRSAAALVGMAEALLSLDRNEEALKAALKAHKLGARDAHARHVEGQAHLANKQYRQALRPLLAAALARPDNPVILADLGQAQLETKALAAAQKSFEKSLARKKRSRAQAGLARTHMLKGNWKKAGKAYEKAAWLAKREDKPKPDVARLFVQGGRAILRDERTGKKRYGMARRLFRFAAAATPENPEPHYEIAAAWDRQDKFNAARTHYHKVLQIDPKHSKTLLRLGLLEYADGNDSKAKELLISFLKSEDLPSFSKRDQAKVRKVLKRIK